jgi:choline dehydrogenase-like flavoprotein
MIADIHTVPSESVLESDVCIIGAGAAGIVLARQFTDSHHQVILLESGGFRRELRTQNLYAGPSIGERYFRSLDECRSRYFGGSTNCWVGICTPLNEIDFAKRSWVPWSGWPIEAAELGPYVRRAHDICGAGPFIYDGKAWQMTGIPNAGFSPDRFERFVWHYNKHSDAAIEFGKRFRSELQRARNIRVFLHASATELLTDPSGQYVERVRVGSLDGATRYVRAKVFVLACGGIENARLLLVSNSVHPNGLGNQRDFVGRFFQEHLEVPCATLFVPDGPNPAVRYSRLSRLGGSFSLPGLSLAPKAQEVHQTLNGSISVDPFFDPEGPFTSFENLISDLGARRMSRQTIKHFWKVVRASRTLAPEAWGRLAHGERPRGDAHRFVIYARAEQSPNPASRITLAREVDELGMPRAALEWRTTPLDRKAIRLLSVFAAEEFTRLGFGQVTPSSWLAGEEWPDTLAGGNHHMGTTRMSEDESTGVVDRDCRIHRLHGLYIAGSSIFPTSGYANPTLTIIAMALRLADHLRGTVLASPDDSSRQHAGATPLPGRTEEISKAL